MDGGRRESRVRCVLWHAPELPVPESLLSALSRRGIGFVARTTASRALAEACALSIEAPADRCVLLLVEPGRLAGSDEVLDIVERGTHRVAAWVFEERSPVQLRAAAARPAVSADPGTPARPSAPRVVIAGGLRARLEMPERAPAPVSEPAKAASPEAPRRVNGHAAHPNGAPESGTSGEESGLLSREELDILLGRGAEG